MMLKEEYCGSEIRSVTALKHLFESGMHDYQPSTAGPPLAKSAAVLLPNVYCQACICAFPLRKSCQVCESGEHIEGLRYAATTRTE